MNERYFGRVVQVIDQYTIVINKGQSEVQEGDKFLVVGLGDIIKDPESGEELERLEIVRGKVKVFHIQSKISTLKSCEYEREEDRKEIKKVRKIRKSGAYNLLPLTHFPGEEITETESVEPGERRLKELKDVEVGDYVIKL